MKLATKSFIRLNHGAHVSGRQKQTGTSFSPDHPSINSLVVSIEDRWYHEEDCVNPSQIGPAMKRAILQAPDGVGGLVSRHCFAWHPYGQAQESLTDRLVMTSLYDIR